MNRKTSFEKAGMRYRRATINDVGTLVNFRIRFLNELGNHPENEKTEMLRNSLKQYFSESIPSNYFVGCLAECEGKIVGTSEWSSGRCQEDTEYLKMEDSDTSLTCTPFPKQEEKASAHGYLMN